MNKEDNDSLEEVQKEITILADKLSALYKKRDAFIKSQIDYQGKCLYHEHYGYIYVQTQYVYNGYFVLQGFTFKDRLTPFRDDFYYKVDALGEWNIRFSDNLFSNKVKEITKREFLKKFNKELENYKKSVSTILKNIL